MKSCEVCNSSDIRTEVIVQTNFFFETLVHTTDYKVFTCNTCDNSFADKSSVKKHTKALRTAQQKAKKLLTLAKIKEIRKLYGETQGEFSKRLGISKQIYVKYENGSLLQSRAIDKTLRILRSSN